MVFLWLELLGPALELMLCINHISIKELNTRKDPSLQVAAVVAAAAVTEQMSIITWI